MCPFVECVKDNYYARFQYPSHLRYRETHFSILLDYNSDKVDGSVKCRSRVPGHGACL